jgi:hypothetical protein
VRYDDTQPLVVGKGAGFAACRLAAFGILVGLAACVLAATAAHAGPTGQAELKVMSGTATASTGVETVPADGSLLPLSLSLTDFDKTSGNTGWTSNLDAAVWGLGGGNGSADISTGDQLFSYITTKGSLKSLTIELSETGLEAGNLDKFLFTPAFTSIFQTHGGDILNYAVYIDPNDNLFGETDEIFSGHLTGTGARDSASPDLIEYLAAPFSLTEVLTVTLDPSATGMFSPTVDGSVTVFTPEPSAIACLGSAVLLLGLIGNRRRTRR